MFKPLFELLFEPLLGVAIRRFSIATEFYKPLQVQCSVEVRILIRTTTLRCSDSFLDCYATATRNRGAPRL